MKNYQKGSHRDKSILASLENLEGLNTDQIRLLHFSNLSQNQLVCQRRMKALTDQKRVKRSRYSANEPYLYYLGKKPQQLEHRLGVNWIYVWQVCRCRRVPDYRVSYFQPEETFKDMRSDAILIVQNTFKKEYILYLVEYDVAESGNPFNKVSQYNDLYETDHWSRRWWHKYATGFPSILVVTTGTKVRILKHTENPEENRNGLDFQVYTIEELKGECFNELNHG